MFYRFLRWVLVIGLCLPPLAMTSYAGGWGVTTINAMPDVIVVGRKATFEISVRQHGIHLMTDIEPAMRFAHPDGSTIDAVARAGDAPGRYVVDVVFTKPGVWSWQMTSFPPMRMIALDVVDPRHEPGARYRVAHDARTAAGQRERGRRLFQSKGCHMCHAHSAVYGSGEFRDAYGSDGAPSLTPPRWTAVYLRQWLADPTALKPKTKMPNLWLNRREIEALAAFLIDEGVE